jgi:hypothetical protein
MKKLKTSPIKANETNFLNNLLPDDKELVQENKSTKISLRKVVTMSNHIKLKDINGRMGINLKP